MSEQNLPPTWATVRLKELARSRMGKTILKSDLTETGLPVYSAGASTEPWGRLEGCEVSYGADTLVISARGNIGMPKRPRQIPFVCTQTTIACSAYLPETVDWLFWFLSQFDYSTKSSQTTIPMLRTSDVDSFEIPLPPLAEQKRIVAKIEELFSELEAGEESLRVARRQLGVYRQSLLKQAFEGKLTAQWRTQNPAKLESPATLPEAEGPHVLPAGWRWIKLGTAIDEPAYGTSKKCSYESSGLGVLRIPNVVNGAIEADDLKFAEFTDDERKSYELRSGDLLLIRSNGSVSIVGRCAIVEPKHTGFLYAGYLIRLRPRSTLLDSRFLLSQFASHRLRSQIEFSAKSTSGVNNINSKEIQRLIIALPSLPEQQEIVRLLDEQFEVIERNEREIDGALRSSAALRQAILHQAFTGRLVPQDPADEPASALLARLRAEREAAPSPARLGRRKIDQV